MEAGEASALAQGLIPIAGSGALTTGPLLPQSPHVHIWGAALWQAACPLNGREHSSPFLWTSRLRLRGGLPRAPQGRRSEFEPKMRTLSQGLPWDTHWCPPWTGEPLRLRRLTGLQVAGEGDCTPGLLGAWACKQQPQDGQADRPINRRSGSPTSLTSCQERARKLLLGPVPVTWAVQGANTLVNMSLEPTGVP